GPRRPACGVRLPGARTPRKGASSMKERQTDGQPLCPSARPEMPGAVAFGAVAGTVEAPRLVHFAGPQPVSDELLASARPAEPTEVFRFAAPCAGHAC